MKMRYDKSRNTNVKYDTGDIVYVKSLPKATGESTKLQSRYKGPFVVTEILPSDTYRIQHLNREKNSTFNSTAHVSQLKIWRKPVDSDSDSEGDDDSDVAMDTINDEKFENVNSYDDSRIRDDVNSGKEYVDSTRENIFVNPMSSTNPVVNNNNRTQRIRQRPKRFDDYDM